MDRPYRRRRVPELHADGTELFLFDVELEPIRICNSGDSGMVGMKSTLVFHLISSAPRQEEEIK
jgi:hypothetical protein